jgi:inner membrane protease ATP23
MAAAIRGAGCPDEVDRDPGLFRCAPCPPDLGALAYYTPGKGVTLCQEQVKHVTTKAVSASLTHELIHAYDNCRFNLDMSNCVHVACTEIRASALSGECNFSYELMRGKFGFFRQHRACVERRALLSLRKHPQCEPMHVARAAIDTAWKSCYNNEEPLDGTGVSA